ncbi:glucosamine--fructose-6-phosphate aminotransferase (isomerizing) [Halarchaeum solikamskense]|uniref:glutamine--fructose-6-phosphate transaminase (isomerizing) n=1 Tax=Halarchaeum nitratireducens TaxID=489913 RepID=UPI001B3AF18A|nr:glutamine--fructose-6-phosphate transaminase (isomerizing) [Halarchaeum solikamskense]MBP2252624.1 glucosamine--fructose-6-phosphate aminotransferase (isomerizing) [Halarchaeum solikamskense]
MCGIVGYAGRRDALPLLTGGLFNLEYRGYDSAGVALREGDGVTVYKTVGEVDALRAEVPVSSEATVGIGHTRWSTHGKPTDENAHPHTDCTGDVAVVHNGIIDNYDALKAELEGEGHTFASATDTEVVPHLVEDELADGKSAKEAFRAVLDRLEGSFALAMVVGDSDEIYLARQDSPLCVGHGDGETFVGSDVTAFLEHAREVTYLENGDLAVVTLDGVTVEHDGESVERPVEQIEWDADAAEKGGYEHYMLKEIHEQPQALRQALSGRVDELQGTVDLGLDLPAEYLRSLEEIQIVACGTSYHAGLYAAHLIETHADVRVTVHVASEYAFRGGRDPWRTLVVAVTQSGETAETLGALRDAARTGARTLAVTNTVGSSVTRAADDALYIRAGPEIGVAATKTFVSQVATLALFAVHVGRVRGTLSATEASAILGDVRGLPGAVQQALDADEQVRAVAEEYADSEAFFFIGRYLGHPVALEGALKLKEISYDHAEGFPAGELKHGPLALVTEQTPVLAVLTDGANADATLNSVKEAESRGAPVIGCLSDGRGEKLLDDTLDVPEIGEMSPLVANVYLQLFAYHVANLKGRAIDKPRNLAKSVTVE